MRTDFLDHFKYMRTKQDHLACTRKFTHELSKDECGADIKARFGLVENQEFGVM